MLPSASLLRVVQDGSPTTWSASELSDILFIWRSVSEDYAAWDVDVTTEDPGDAYLFTNGMRAVIGGSYADWYGTACGGVAYVGIFGKHTMLSKQSSAARFCCKHTGSTPLAACMQSLARLTGCRSECPLGLGVWLVDLNPVPCVCCCRQVHGLLFTGLHLP